MRIHSIFLAFVSWLLLPLALVATEPVHLGDPLAEVRGELLGLLENDQKFRRQLAELERNSATNPAQIQAVWQQVEATGHANVRSLEVILAKHGWLGPKEVGAKASDAIFLVIQHAALAVQQKYLPLMRAAVVDGRAAGSSLALLEDRVALREGRPQTYGSQIGYDEAADSSFVMPLADPDNVDARRAAVGLPPLADYVKQWKIVWDLAAYKQQLPTLKNPFAPEPPPSAPVPTK